MSNHKEIEKHSEKITKNKPFINKDKWEGLNLPSKKDNPELSEKNNVTIALNVLYIKKEKIYPGYVLKRNSDREKQVLWSQTDGIIFK